TGSCCDDILSSFLTRPPPISTLFPYTTLFRSDPSVAASNWGDARGYEDNKITTVGLSYIHSISNELKNKTAMFYSYLDHYEPRRSEEHTSELQSRENLVCRLLLEKKKTNIENG